LCAGAFVTFGRRGLKPETSRFRDDERFEDVSEDFVLAEQLVHGRLLFVPQDAELAGLVDDGGVGGDLFIRWSAQVPGDLGDECRDVIEQSVRWEHIIRRNNQQFLQTVEPLARKREALGVDALRHDAGVILRGRDGHGALRNPLRGHDDIVSRGLEQGA
jgi:hypothetical protein